MELHCGDLIFFWDPSGRCREEDRVYAVIVKIPAPGNVAPWVSTSQVAPWHDTLPNCPIQRLHPLRQNRSFSWQKYRLIAGELPGWEILRNQYGLQLLHALEKTRIAARSDPKFGCLFSVSAFWK
jgi:hypothetical protein